MEDREKVEVMRSIHSELARHFGGISKIESGWGAGTIKVNRLDYTEEEFDELLEVMVMFARIEASRLARLRDKANEFLELNRKGGE